MASTKKTTKKTTVHARKHAPKKRTVTSFKQAAETEPFFTFKITKQTVYWTVLGLVIILLSLWIINLQIQVSNIYDSVEVTTSNSPVILKKK